MKRKIKETTSGSVATVSTGGPTIARGASIYGRTPKKSMFKGKVRETAVNEEELSEDDLIIVPGKKMIRKNGLIPRDQVRTDHEVSMARSDLVQSAKNAKAIFALIKDVSEDEGIPGWVQEKLIKASDYLNTVREYLEGQQVEAELAGSYGMKSCGCDSECDCGPDFRGMFESVMSKKGVAEGWKDKVAGAAIGAAGLGGIGAAINMSPNVTIQGQQARLAVGNVPANAKLVTTDDGKKVHVWSVRGSNPKSAGSHQELVYKPAEVKEQGVAEDQIDEIKLRNIIPGLGKQIAKSRSQSQRDQARLAGMDARADGHLEPKFAGDYPDDTPYDDVRRERDRHHQRADRYDRIAQGKSPFAKEGVAEGTEQVYKVLAVDKSNALSDKVMLTVKAGSIEEVFERLAINDWYPFEINGVEVINGKRLKKDVKEGTGDEASVRRELADAIKDYEWHKQGGSSRGLEYAIDRIKKLQAQLPKSKTGLDIDRSVPGITRATLSDIDPGTMGKKLEKLSSFSDYQAGVADQGRSGRVRPKISPDNYTQRDDMAEGFSDVVKGVKRALKGKEHPDVVAAKHAGRAMGHYNLGDIQAGDKESQRYAKTRDMHLKAKGVLEDTVDEKAVSKQQQKFFGMVHALQKGKPVKGASPKLKQAAADISKSDVKDFAKTRHSGLPSKVKKG